MKVGPSKWGRGGEVWFSFYGNGEIAIIIGRGENSQTGTTNITPYRAPPPGPDHVWLKGWSENEGVPEALEAGGVCQRTGETFPTGFCFAERAKLSPEAIEEVKRAKWMAGL